VNETTLEVLSGSREEVGVSEAAGAGAGGGTSGR
jgi:hypothetical protein